MSDVIGLIPAAGHARRISPLPCSKELYPIGFISPERDDGKQPKVACHYLFDHMKAAGIFKTYIVLREGKWDIPTYLSDGRMFDLNIAYIMVQQSYGVPYTLDQAYPFVRDGVIAFGYPDILVQGENPFVSLLQHLALSKSDIVLGLSPVYKNQKTDMVDFGQFGEVREIVILPSETQLQYSWAVAVWTPTFTKFLHTYLLPCRASAATEPELSLGHVIQAAIRDGLRVKAVAVSSEPFLDIGTPEGLLKAIRRFAP